MIIAYQAQAEEEWTIDRYETLSYPEASGVGYIFGGISGYMVVALWKNPNEPL